MSSRIRFTIEGEASSKANSRKFARMHDGRTISIKSDKARAFEKSALAQIPKRAQLMLDVPCGIRLRMFYADERSDLEPDLVLDCLQPKYRKSKTTGERVLVQPGVVTNDRRFRVIHAYHAIDRARPRVEITVWRLDGQRALMVDDEVDSGEVVW